MPKTIKLEAHLSQKELENRYRKARDPVLRSHYQILWLIGEGKTTTQVMEVTGYSRSWIQLLARRYNANVIYSTEKAELSPGPFWKLA